MILKHQYDFFFNALAVFKSRFKIEFDKENNILSIFLPDSKRVDIGGQGKSISLSDQFKNRIKMDESGITIESVKNITLKAQTDIAVESGANLSLKAKSNTTMEGLKIEAKAQTEFTAKGDAKAELSASGQTVVKGAVVMIN
ncbi:MAG: hypothetical protein LBF62_05150 [Tannerellaceae bacterium]|nr:hypothetical protein [Tannerellaceae bacterium]